MADVSGYDYEPAFPRVVTEGFRKDEFNTHSVGGLTILDWFAGQALIGLLAQDTEWKGDTSEENAKTVAEVAWIVADAMLKARKS